MLTIRLQRTGTKNKSAFRIVLTEAHRSASKKALEVLGHYNPRLKQFAIKDSEKLNYWIGKHVAISPTVYNLLVEKKMVEGKKVKAWQPKKSASAGKEASAPAAEVAAATEAPAKQTAPVVEPAVEPQA